MVPYTLPKEYHPDFQNPRKKPACPVELSDSYLVKNLDFFAWSHNGVVYDLVNNRLSYPTKGMGASKVGQGTLHDHTNESIIELVGTKDSGASITAYTTIGLVYWTENASATDENILGKINAGNDFSMKFNQAAGGFSYNLQGVMSTFASNQSVSSLGSTSANQYQKKPFFMSLSIGDTGMEMYANGELVASNTWAQSPIRWNANDNMMQGGSGIVGSPFRGHILFTAGFNRKLSSAEHKLLANDYTHLVKPKTPPVYFTLGAIIAGWTGTINGVTNTPRINGILMTGINEVPST